MSRAALIKRLDELEARLLEAYVPPWRRFLASLSEEELEALEREEDPGLACVHHGSADFVPGCDCLDRAKALEPGGRSEVLYVAGRLHRGEEPVPRPAPEAVMERVPVASLDLTEPSAAEEPPPDVVVPDEPLVSPEEPQRRRIRKSTDLPESKAEQRAQLFELDYVRKAEPGDAPGSGFRWRRPPRRRSRRL